MPAEAEKAGVTGRATGGSQAAAPTIVIAPSIRTAGSRRQFRRGRTEVSAEEVGWPAGSRDVGTLALLEGEGVAGRLGRCRIPQVVGIPLSGMEHVGPPRQRNRVINHRSSRNWSARAGGERYEHLRPRERRRRTA